MTEEELDEARAREAVSRINPQSLFDPHGIIERDRAAILAARLARENWRPVDPDLIEAREIVAKWHETNFRSASPVRQIDPKLYRDGLYDGGAEVQQALAAIKQTKAKYGVGQ